MGSARIWCAVPVYNNAATVREVVEGCVAALGAVVVVDDGSTDARVSDLLEGLPVTVVRHDVNRGKGAAIMTAARLIGERGGEYMITLDADGQHRPADIPRIVGALDEGGNRIVIGCRDLSDPNVPARSRFGRDFANFWMKVETGVDVRDCQSGFRAYPVRHLAGLGVRGRRFDFEAEVIARAAWTGIEIRCVDVSVWYPPPAERVSHFRPFLDNLRISLAHARMVGRQLLPLPHRKRVRIRGTGFAGGGFGFLRHPVRALKLLLEEHATPGGLGAAAAVGSLLAILPFFFSHTIVILYVATRLNLNKVMALNIQHLFAPPFVPALCIEVGHLMRHGEWLTEFSFRTLGAEAPSRIWEWILGSFVVAPVLAPLTGIAVYAAAALIRRRSRNGGE